MEKQELIEKIRKLMALATSPNEAEATLAMKRATELMAKYNIEHADIKEKVKFIQVAVPFIKKPTQNHHSIWPNFCQCIAFFFDCQILTSSHLPTTQCGIVGTELNCELAIQAIHTVFEQAFNSMLEEFQRVGVLALISAPDFYVGFSGGLFDKFNRAKQAYCNEHGMVLVNKDLEDFLDSQGITRKETLNMQSSVISELGYVKGQEAELRAGLNSKPQTNERKLIG